jgi:hypothetical protein
VAISISKYRFASAFKMLPDGHFQSNRSNRRLACVVLTRDETLAEDSQLAADRLKVLLANCFRRIFGQT